jgi:uncharacterized repeat protein (TIGR01451 family)
MSPKTRLCCSSGMLASALPIIMLTAVSPAFAADAVNSASVAMPAGAFETNAANNTATDTDTIFAALAATNNNASGINGLIGATAVLNVLTGDTVNGTAATTANVVISVAPSSTVPAQLTFNAATGNVDVKPGTAAGTYSFDYQICEQANPTNCKTATISVTVVAAAIVADPDAASGINGATGATNVVNALDGDTFNAVAATTTAVEIKIVTPATPASAGAPVPVLDITTGQVNVPAGTPAGNYTIRYEICDKLNPTNCASNQITVAVVASPILASDDSVEDINGLAGATAVVNAFTGDTVNGAAAAPSNTILSVAAGHTVPPELSFDPATGDIDVNPGTPAGTYSFRYELCEKLNPSNCTAAMISVKVIAAEILADEDTVSGINGATGADDVLSVLDGDTLDGNGATTASVAITVVTEATPVTAGAPVPVLDPATGQVSVPPGTPAGSYKIDYEICDQLNPTNCATNFAIIDVVASPIVATNDSASGINGLVGATAVVNAFTSDQINGVAASASNAVLSVAPTSTVPAQLTFNPATGSVNVKPGTPAGTYSFDYQICEKLNPGNCKTATISVTVVAAAISTDPDSATGINGATGASNVTNVLDGDTLNSMAATVSTVDIKLTTPATPASAGAPVPTLDTATGQVSVPAGTPAGSYTIGYEICDKINPTNCSANTATIEVVSSPIVAANDTASGINGLVGATAVVNAFTSDQINGAAASASNAVLSVAPTSTVPAQLTFNSATGSVDVAAGTPAGTYSFDYQICEKLNPSNCKTATISVTVVAAAITADTDVATGINGATGASNVTNVLDGDTLNSVAATTSAVDITLITPATPASAGAPVPTLDIATGQVSVPAGTPAGSYTIDYEICEKLNPTNCAANTVTVEVVASPIIAANDSATGISGMAGATAVVNAFTSDQINGAAASASNAVLSVAPTSTVPAQLTFDPATGNVDVKPGTPAGTYSFDYQICEKLNPSNCKTATISVTVVAAVITADPDSVTGVNGATGATNVTNVLDGDTLDGSPVTPSLVDITLITPATPASAGAPVPTLDLTTGQVNVPAGTPAGSYTIGYEICEKLNSTNCAANTVTVEVVASPIVAANDTASGINGLSGATAVVNAFTSDQINGAAASASNAVLSVATGSTVPAQLTFDPATGSVDVKPGTPAGTYSFDYQICEKLNPANCKTATISVTVDAAPIAASADAPTPVNGKVGGNDVIDVFANDTLNGVAVTLSSISASVITPATAINGGPVPVLDPATGLVDVPAGTPAGSYTIGYEICETLNPTNCASSIVTIVVTAAPIAAVADTPASVNGASGNPSLTNAFTNDTLNGAPLVIAEVDVTIESPASNPGVELDPATGIVSVAPGTPAGTYTITYKICEKLNPTNCATSNVTVVVDAAPIAASADSANPVNGANGVPLLVNVLTNDLLNGLAATTANTVMTVTSPAANPGVVLDPATGNVSVAAGTPAGTYSIGYQICEVLNPGNCATATVVVVVDAGPISAVADTPAAVNGALGNPDLGNAFANDLFNGQPVVLDAIVATITTPAVPATPGAAVPAIDPATGLISVPPGTPAGTYTITYQICEKLNPTNCASASVTLTVEASTIAATADAPAMVRQGIGSTNLVNAFANDQLGGEAIDPAKIIATVTVPASHPGVVLDPATGIVSVSTDVPEGEYVIGYQICEKLNPTNCSTSSVTVIVGHPLSTVSGMVFTDNDGDKVFDPGEAPRAGWIVEVVLNGVVVATTTTDADGKYSVANLPSGPGYEIRFINPENHVVYDIIKSLTMVPNTNMADQNQPIDPSGVIYDSVTRAPLPGAQVMLTNASGVPLPTICFADASQAGQTTGASGEYRFDIVPGAAAQCPLGETIYKVSVVPPAGYASGSTVLLPQTGPFDPTGMASPVAISSSVTAPTEANPIYYLDFRLANGDPDIINNHIALDPFLTRAPLTVTKTSIRRSANVGDLVPYEITVRNNENVQRAGVNVVDILPAGMNYVTGTGLVNGMAVEPVRTERQVAWTGQVVPANATVRYSLTLVVGAGVTGGERVNTGIAQNGIDGTTISNRGTAVVSIVPSAVFDCSEVLGKVFEDANRNGYQDEGEPGVPGVRLVTVNGQMITTDGQGRYHVACAAVPDARIGSNFVLKVDPATLPLGWEPTSENPRSIRLTRGRFGELNFGVAPAASPTSGAGGPTPTRTEGGE